MSLPAEIYTFGTIFMLNFFFWPIGIYIASRFYIPVFRDLKIASMYKVSVTYLQCLQFLTYP